MCNVYINNKLNIISKNDLKKKIVMRIDQLTLKNGDDKKSIFFPIIKQLSSEISQTYSLFDNSYTKEINSLITEVIAEKIQSFVKEELKKSSDNNLNYLKSVINTPF